MTPISHDDLGEVVTVATAVQRLGVTRQRVHAAIRAGLLASVRLGAITLVSAQSVERYRSAPRRSGRPRILRNK